MIELLRQSPCSVFRQKFEVAGKDVQKLTQTLRVIQVCLFDYDRDDDVYQTVVGQ